MFKLIDLYVSALSASVTQLNARYISVQWLNNVGMDSQGMIVVVRRVNAMIHVR